MQEINNLCMGCMSALSGEDVCTVCGFDSRTYNQPGSLPLRTMLAGRYLVGKVIGATGEGFTYLSFDTVTESVVKVTEYFPTGLCARNIDSTVNIAGETAYIYNDGIIKFVELHKTLAGLSDLSAVYRIIDVFEVNNTAYSVAENPPGISFKEFLLRNGGALTWDQVRPLIMPLVNTLRVLHQNGVIHGGISPETLIVGRDGRIRIADFCVSAVRVEGSNMVSQLYPGFAAIEQHRGEGITPATDVYAVAAVIFRTLTGNPPPDAKQRIEKDNMTFSRSVAEQVPRSVLIAMANALRLDPESRTKSMDVLRANLQSAEQPVAAPQRVQNGNNSYNSNNNGDNNKPKKSGSKKYVFIAAIVTILIIAIGAGAFYLLTKDSGNKNSSSSSELPETSYESYLHVSAASDPEKFLSVPDFSGKTYADLLEKPEYAEYAEWFEFKVVRKEYNSKYSKGVICAQSVKIGTAAKEGTIVEFTVSLGPKEFTIPKSLKGMNKDQAVIELLKRGLDFNNIHVEPKMGEKTEKENIVFETTPAMGEKITPDDSITIYYNVNVIEEEPEIPEDTGEYSGEVDGY